MRLKLSLLLVLSIFGCKSVNSGSRIASAPEFETSSGLKMCFGYRGNGTSVFATMGGIARMLDQFGAPEAVVGTSSGSVAAFLTESVLIPNSVYGCPDCTIDKVNERRSFMIKAFPLMIPALLASDDMAKDYRKLQRGKETYDFIMEHVFHAPGAKTKEPEPSKATEAVNPDPKTAPNKLSSPYVQSLLSFSALSALKLGSHEIEDMISPEFYKISGLGGIPRPKLVGKAVENLLNFQGVSEENGFTRQSLMYPGIANFDYIFDMVGFVGDWYAGYGNEFPREKLTALLDTCAASSRSQWWNAIAERKYGDSDCGKEYFKLFAEYYNERKKKHDSGKRRIDETIGAHVAAFVSASAISGNDIVDAMTAAANDREFDRIDELSLGRKNFAVLYFGPNKYKDMLTKNKVMFDDVITNNLVSMGSLSWKEAMRASAQEPATGRSLLFEENGQRYLATGGFVDQLQSKMLRMIGCENTVMFNTNKPVTKFATRYAPRIWNEDLTLIDDMLSTTNPASAESKGFAETDALLCSRWSSYGLTEMWEMADNSYHEYMFTTKPSLLATGDMFTRESKEVTTRNELPKGCYSLEEKRNNRYGPYKP